MPDERITTTAVTQMRTEPGTRRLRGAHFALLAFAAVSLALIAVIRLTAASPDGGDLCRDYLDAQRLLAGHSAYVPFGACGALHHSPHPPLALLILVPLTALPIGAAAALWDVIMLGALYVALALIWRVLRDTRGRQRPSTQVEPDGGAKPWRMPLVWGVLGLLAVWPPLLDTWLEAQIGPLLLVLLVLAWRARRRDQPWAAGAWLALATLLRLYPVLLFAYPLLRREWRMVGGGLITGIGVTLLTLPFIGPADYWTYLTREAPGASAEWVNDGHNASLRGWLGTLFAGNATIAPVDHVPALIAPLYILGAGLILGLLIWRIWRARGAPLASSADDLAWLIALPAALLISPLAWPHYFIVLLLPGFVAAAWALRAGMRQHALLLGIAGLIIYLDALGLRLTLPLPRVLLWPIGIFIFQLPTYALALFAVTFWRLATAGSSGTPVVAGRELDSPA